MSRFVDFKAVKAAVSMLQVLEHYDLVASFKRSGNSLSGPSRFMEERTGRSFASRWKRTAGTVSAPARVAETFWISSRARRV